MQPSASSASVTSSSSSSFTKSSTGSKKARTIIVARNISDNSSSSTSSLPGATSSTGERARSHSATIGAAPLAKQLARDEKTGKLTTYAALGNVDDLEFYNQYLAEQFGGKPSASELRHVSTLPQQFNASMKRNTLAQTLQNQQSDGNNSSITQGDYDQQKQQLPKPTSDQTEHLLMAINVENDAKKRREALVAHRKWLQSLPIHERIAHQRQQNVLKHWKQVNKEWEQFKARASRKLGKHEKDLVMSRAAEYREQVELYDTLQKAQPLADKLGGDMWMATLRGDSTRFVPVGNIFSGLFCPIRESTRIGPRVRRPLDYHHDAAEELDKNLQSKPLSILEKRSLELLAKKKRRLRKQLDVLVPHEIEPSSSTRLTVMTMDLFEWASTSTNKKQKQEDEQSRLVLPSLDYEENANWLGTKEPSSRSLQSSSRHTILTNRSKGSSLRLFPAAIASEHDKENQEYIDNLYRDSSTPLCLSFFVDINTQQQQSMIMQNDGSTTLHFQWMREESDHPDLSPQLRLHDHFDHDRDRRRVRQYTSISCEQGTLLPGDERELVFTFVSQTPGVFLEKWLLDLDPIPRVKCWPSLSTSLNNGNVDHEGGHAESSDVLPLEIHLSCTAVDNFVPASIRDHQRQAIDKQENVFFVEKLIGELLSTIDSIPRIEFSGLTPAAATFYALQRDSLDNLPTTESERQEETIEEDYADVHYSDVLIDKCRDLYAQALDIVQKCLNVDRQDEPKNNGSEVTFTLTELTTDSPSSFAAPDSSHATADAEIQPEELRCKFPLEWDGHLRALHAIAKEADRLNAERLKILVGQLQKEHEEAEEEEDDMEEEEEEEEEEEDEEDEDEDEDEDEEDDEEKDEKKDDGDNSEAKQEKSTQEKPTQEKPTQEKRKVNLREQRAQDRAIRCKNLQLAIRTLRPRLQDAFASLWMTSCVSPYTSSTLQSAMQERIGALVSEIPVVHDIARMINQFGSDEKQRRLNEANYTHQGVKSLLTRAIDEAIAVDMQRQWHFDQERRRFDQMYLSEKISYEQLPSCIASLNKSRVILLYVDLDLAHWFSLVKVNAGNINAPSGSIPESEETSSAPYALAWKFSQTLVEHEEFIPDQVAQVVESIQSILQATNDSEHPLRIVLVSEMSCPPLTKVMKKLLGSTIENNSSTDVKIAEKEEYQRLEQLSTQLTFQGVVMVLKRALPTVNVTFCPTIVELETQLTDRHVQSEEVAALEQTPRVFLMEHLRALGIDLWKKQALANATDASSTIQAASVPTPEQKHESEFKSTAASRRKSTMAGKAAPAPAEAKATAIPTPTPTPEKEANESLQIPPGSAEERQAIETLRSKLVQICDVHVLDTFPASSWGNGTVAPFNTADNVTNRNNAMRPMIIGPKMLQDMSHWTNVLQARPDRPDLLSPPQQCVTAVVGGKKLERKIRFIDGLLEIADVIYFVGEIGMSFYRVLHTKHAERKAQRRQQLQESMQLEDASSIPLSAAAVNMWSLLIPAVESLLQKAHRRCVKLLLPLDWMVGASLLEDQDTVCALDDDEDGEEEEREEEDEEEEKEEHEGGNKRKKKGRSLKKRSNKRKKPVVEPEVIDTWKKQWTYDDEIAHVALTTTEAQSQAWISFENVTDELLSQFQVIDGNASILKSVAVDGGEDDDDDEEHIEQMKMSNHDGVDNGKRISTFEYDWTLRAFDVGPISMNILVHHLHHILSVSSDDQHHQHYLVVNGVFGVVECQNFDSATKQWIDCLESVKNMQRDVFVAGQTTARCLQRLEISKQSGKPKIVTMRTVRNAAVLKSIIAGKSHPTVVPLASSLPLLTTETLVEELEPQ